MEDNGGLDPTVLTTADYQRAAAALDVDIAAIRAVAEVETAGSGFLADGRPDILYEAHVFHRVTGGVYGNARDRYGVKLSVPKWDRTLYGHAGAHQWERLEDARKLHEDGAHKACSWGLFQVMGENYRVCGFSDTASFVEAMEEGAARHLDAFVRFVQGNRLDGKLRAHDWAGFARGYNGPGYAQNAYDRKLEAAYDRHKRSGG